MYQNSLSLSQFIVMAILYIAWGVSSTRGTWRYWWIMILQILWTLLGPFLRSSPFGLISEESSCDFVHFCSTTVQKFLTVLEIFVQLSFMGRTCNSLKGPHRNKMKDAYCSEIYSEQILFSNAL